MQCLVTFPYFSLDLLAESVNHNLEFIDSFFHHWHLLLQDVPLLTHFVEIRANFTLFIIPFGESVLKVLDFILSLGQSHLVVF